MSEPMGLFAKYLVLRPRGSDVFAQTSRRAMRAYADWLNEHASDPDHQAWLSCWGLHEGNEAPTHWMPLPAGPK